MADPSSQTERARPATNPGVRAGLDSASADRFEEIIDTDRDAGRYSIHPQQRGLDLKRSKLGIADWVMAVVAGLVLGVVMTMIAAM